MTSPMSTVRKDPKEIRSVLRIENDEDTLNSIKETSKRTFQTIGNVCLSDN